MATDTFKEQIGAALDEAFGAENVHRGARLDAATGELSERSYPRQAPLPMFEGLVVDRYELAFSGKVDLNKFLDSDVALIRKARLGQTVRVTVEALVVGRPHGFKPAKEDDEDSEDEVTSGHKLRVLSVWLPE